MVSKLFLGAVAGATAVVGYCIYFDHTRRSHPLYRQRVREKRARNRAAANRATGMPDPTDPEAMQRYFMIQLQRGEACLMNGMVEESVQHFSNAVRASGSPSQLLRILAESLPPQVFSLIVRALESETAGAMGGPTKTSTTVRTTTTGPSGVVFDEELKETVVSTGATVTLVEDDVE
ncbi:mitochondrial import receptor subunit TOM20 homolog B-like [Paramacrobiotus metropolitanus]|uniref:mitochondrial import receptor subunit TOM20 homolog B-like n=1 Tax=Paramacrobiotus metropolitanus TaxID=2943436 RepID=UPI002445EB0C|nr:mitochondrial import receptor subunit TOM20 homolog B-like [Paramacrobiotus metropolitanus]